MVWSGVDWVRSVCGFKRLNFLSYIPSPPNPFLPPHPNPIQLDNFRRISVLNIKRKTQASVSLSLCVKLMEIKSYL